MQPDSSGEARFKRIFYSSLLAIILFVLSCGLLILTSCSLIPRFFHCIEDDICQNVKDISFEIDVKAKD